MNEQYVTNADADLYIEGKLDTTIWDRATEAKKTKALISATRLIDSLNFIGQKLDPDQALEFPRDLQTVVPQKIKDACCEIAYALLDGRDVEYDAETDAQSSASLEGARAAINTEIVDMAKIHNIPSTVAWGYLRPFLRDGTQITLLRV